MEARPEVRAHVEKKAFAPAWPRRSFRFCLGACARRTPDPNPNPNPNHRSVRSPDAVHLLQTELELELEIDQGGQHRGLVYRATLAGYARDTCYLLTTDSSRRGQRTRTRSAR
eukprot:scaffold137123_cov109-Phaeocystis_antarctica.AAC.1